MHFCLLRGGSTDAARWVFSAHISLRPNFATVKNLWRLGDAHHRQNGDQELARTQNQSTITMENSRLLPAHPQLS